MKSVDPTLIRHFKQLTTSLPGSCFLLSPDGTIQAVNLSATKILGHLQPLVGASLIDLITDHPDTISEFLHTWSSSTEPVSGVLTWQGRGDDGITCNTTGNLIEDQSTTSPALLFLHCEAASSTVGIFSSSDRTSATSTITRQPQPESNQPQDITTAALHADEDLYQTLVENIDLAVSLIDPEYNIIMTNSTTEKMHNKPASYYTGKKCFKEFARKEQACPDCPGQTALATGRPQEFTDEKINDDGSSMFLRIRVFPVSWNNGRSSGFIEVVEDITRQKLTEKTLRKSEARLQSIFRAAPIGIGLVSNRKLLWTNQKISEMVGYSSDELQGQSSRILYPDTEEFERVGRKKYEQIKEHGTGTMETRWQRKDGKIVDVLLSSSPLDLDDLAAGVTFTALDITKRKKAEEQIVQKKEEWEKTFNAMGDIITIQDKNLRIVRANKAAYDFFDAQPDAFSGRHCYEIFRGVAEPCPDCPLFETLQDINNHSEIITHENLGKTFHVSSSPILDDKGEIKYLVHIAKDITEQKKLEEELFQAHKMEAIGTLAGGIAHDFNNILAAILGYAELAKIDLQVGGDPVGDMEEVIKATHRAKELVKQILTFSRKAEHKKQPLNPCLIIKESLKLLRASLPTTIEIREEIVPDCGTIMADPTHVQQIIMNLCTNALQAMENEQGTLTVALARRKLSTIDVISEPGVSAGPYIELTVRDTGHGMDSLTMERIFEPYFTTKAIGRGTGMGLALVHGIVQEYGGMIKIESEMGNGTSFQVYFPDEGKKSADAGIENDIALPVGSEHIMVIDDESAIVDLLKISLERLGYKVTGKMSSIEALEAFQAHPENFDIIITDQTMPTMTGAELAKRLLQIRPDIPIILCTGYSSMISEEQAKEIGIREFIMKPADRTALAQIIRKVLDNK